MGLAQGFMCLVEKYADIIMGVLFDYIKMVSFIHSLNLKFI